MRKFEPVPFLTSLTLFNLTVNDIFLALTPNAVFYLDLIFDALLLEDVATFSFLLYCVFVVIQRALSADWFTCCFWEWQAA